MKNKRTKGISLIETLIYVAIFSIFVVALASFSRSILSARVHNQIVLEVNDQGSRAMKTITQTLRNASQVNSPTISNTALNLSVVTDIPATNPTVFSLTGGVLYVTEGSASATALTNSKVVMSNLLFSNLSRSGTPNIIKVSFTLTSASSTSSGDTYSITFDGSSALRK